jgi:biotin-dependent carboxylase-like uncharacterized protein
VIKVIDGGFQTIVVDMGRYGWYWHGLSPSGPMDRFSFVVGNILLGNDENSSGLECCFVGPTLEIMEDCCVVFCGAEVNPKINDAIVSMWQVHRVKPRDIISFSSPKRGVWFYVCFSGGIEVPLVYGSRTTCLPSCIGGYEGRQLRKGDILSLLPAITHPSKVIEIRLEDKYVPSFPGSKEIRVVFGLLQHLVSNIENFIETTWELSKKANRMGYRFYSQGFVYKWTKQERGEPQPFGAGQDPCNAILSPYPVGSIQTDMINGAIVLLQDAVSIGGYVTLGTVIQCDQDLLAHNKPGDKIRFVPVAQEQALHARKKKYELLNRIRESCLRF